jgi:small subunit ribosomal protein S4
MTKRLDSKFHICKKFQQNIWNHPKLHKKLKSLKTTKLSSFSNQTEYSVRLLAKQKLKGFYCNISEKQFRVLLDKSSKFKGIQIDNFIRILESRLDTVLYRSKFAVSFYQARQLINHGIVFINGRKVQSPGYQLKSMDVVEIKDIYINKIQKNIIDFYKEIQENDLLFPSYLEIDLSTMKMIFLYIPNKSDIHYPVQMDTKKVMEYYSR